jgi:tRNA threonylcarbamoyladenosine biosynthesis protein TsaB
MILALKTADHTTQIWILAASVSEPTPAGNGETPDPDLNWESGRQLSDELLTRITGLLQDRDIELTALTGIVIFSGPGSFTSLRIGHTVANALADSLNLPVTGAAGDNWLASGLAELSATKPGVPALPIYGSEANITRPKA